MTERSARQLWRSHKDDRMKQIRNSLSTETLDLVGLSVSYVPANYFDDQPEGYWLYLLGCGGPSDGVKFYASDPSAVPYRVEYEFFWGFDSYKRLLIGKDLKLMMKVFSLFQEDGTVKDAYEKALEGYYGN